MQLKKKYNIDKINLTCFEYNPSLEQLMFCFYHKYKTNWVHF